MKRQIAYCQYQTPLGKISIGALEQKIVFCDFQEFHEEGIQQETVYLQRAYQQIQEYFEGKRQSFDLQYAFLNGTAFQQDVWLALLKIPYGQTVSYQEVASMVHRPRAYRAVGSALRQCPISILLPCHRVIGVHQRLGGYGEAIDRKIYLLDLEKQYVSFV